MSDYERKIGKALNRESPQWENARMPNVERYGRQADAEIATLAARIEALKYTIRRYRYHHGRFPFQALMEALQEDSK